MSPYRAAADVADEAFLRQRKTDWPLVIMPAEPVAKDERSGLFVRLIALLTAQAPRDEDRPCPMCDDSSWVAPRMSR